jgi:PAS domain S-box-containing protein
MKAHLKLTLIYALFGFFWITFSDRIVYSIIPHHTLEELTYFQTFKGVFYVLITAVFLYFLIQKNQQQLTTKIATLNRLNSELANQQSAVFELHNELTDSEQRYAYLFQICPLPLWIFDDETLALLEVNQMALEIYGYERDEMLTLTIKELRPVSEIPKLMQTLQYVSMNNDPYFIGVFKHMKKNGDLMDVEIRSEGFIYKGRNAKLVLAKDITKMLSVEKALKESYDTIVQLEDRERERFAAELHDGLAQNLISIKQFIELARNLDEPTEKHSIMDMLIDVVNNTIQECEQIIHDMRPKELYEGGLINLLNRTCDRLAYASGISIQLEMEPAIEAILSVGDKFQLFRLIQENLNNSIKHASPSAIHINIAIEQDRLMVRYSDNGVGIAENIVNSESAFLGIKQRLSTLNGSFELTTEPLKGAQFCYEIPISTVMLYS